MEGGFNGRTNKLVDGCYSFWQGGLFPLLQRVAPDALRLTSRVGALALGWHDLRHAWPAMLLLVMLVGWVA